MGGADQITGESFLLPILSVGVMSWEERNPGAVQMKGRNPSGFSLCDFLLFSCCCLPP